MDQQGATATWAPDPVNRQAGFQCKERDASSADGLHCTPERFARKTAKKLQAGRPRRPHSSRRYGGISPKRLFRFPRQRRTLGDPRAGIMAVVVAKGRGQSYADWPTMPIGAVRENAVRPATPGASLTSIAQRGVRPSCSRLYRQGAYAPCMTACCRTATKVDQSGV